MLLNIIVDLFVFDANPIVNFEYLHFISVIKLQIRSNGIVMVGNNSLIHISCLEKKKNYNVYNESY